MVLFSGALVDMICLFSYCEMDFSERNLQIRAAVSGIILTAAVISIPIISIPVIKKTFGMLDQVYSDIKSNNISTKTTLTTTKTTSLLRTSRQCLLFTFKLQKKVNIL